MNRIRYIMFAATLFLVLALSAMNTVPAFADDGAPPPEEPAGEVVPPVEEVVTETPPVEEVVPPVEEVVTETPPVEEVVPPVEEVVTETPPTEEPATLPELLEQLPEGTDVVVTNENGEVVPLATEEAARIVEEVKDPLWCPVGVAPNPNSINPACSDDATTLFDLLYNVSGQPYKDGVIWIQSGWDTGWDTTIGGSTWAGSEGYALTLQGGWNGVYGSTALDAADPYSYFDTKITINWIGNVTINNLVIDTDPASSASPAYDDYALDVTTNGTITLNNVSVVNNDNIDASCGGDCVRGGANLDNTGGIGNIVINNSSFDENEGDGLVVNTTGTVTTNNVTANGNGRHGVYIDNDYGLVKTVLMKGVQQYNGNGGSGLVVHSYGAITASNITAVGNGWNANPARGFIDEYSWGDGAHLNNTWSWYWNTAQNVTVNGSSLFDNNANNGLSVQSFGIITVNNITATWNGGDGAYLDNCVFDPQFADAGDCGAKAAKAITVNGTNVFNHNGWYGLDINSSGGALKANNVTASYNDFGGMYMDNRWTNYYDNSVAGTWTIAGYGVFNGNLGTGLTGWAYGPMLLTNIIANDNYSDGAYLRVTNTFTLNGYGIFNNNGGLAWVYDDGFGYLEYYGKGLHLQASSTVTLNNITANGNAFRGVDVTAWRSGLLFASVSFKGFNTFNENGYGYYHDPDGVPSNGDEYWIYSDGLHIETDGKITLNSVTANYNGVDGVYACNHYDTVMMELCSTGSDSGATVQGVTLTGYNTFLGNGYYGFEADSNGAILTNSLTANGNDFAGAYLHNNYNTAAPVNVTLTGVNTFNYNTTGSGLYVYTYGAIAVSSLTADSNGSGGAYLNNYLGNPALTPKPVTVTLYARVNDNGYIGLEIYSLGAVAVANATATDNVDTGVYIDNGWNSLKQSNVTFTGANLFDSNDEHGLYVFSYGAITASNVTSNSNGYHGAYLSNYGGYYTKTITLTGVNNFNWNGANGLYVDANGAVALTRVTANFNDQNAGGNKGIEVYSNNLGTITLTCGVAYGNGGDGIYLIGGGKLVTVKGWYAYGNTGTYNWYFSAPNLTSRICLLP